ncbi:hypothetical protein KR222_000284 [Zaprionus bogoriensis]|nr:hypothetical protein KR222_000284 [Zaprionus bogoriensis]
MPAMGDYLTGLLRRTKKSVLQLFRQRDAGGLPTSETGGAKLSPGLQLDMEMCKLQLKGQDMDLERQQQQVEEFDFELDPDQRGSSEYSSSGEEEVECYNYNQYCNNRSNTRDLSASLSRPPVGFYCK